MTDILHSSVFQVFGIWVAVSCLSGLFVLIIVKIFDAGFRNQSSTDRYQKSIAALIFFFLLNLLGTSYFQGTSFQEEETLANNSKIVSIKDVSTETVPALNSSEALSQNNVNNQEVQSFKIQFLFKCLGFFWMIGAFIFIFKMMGGYFYTRSLILSSQEGIPENWSSFIALKVKQLQINREVIVFESSRMNAAFTFGFLKPIIALPIGFFTSIPPEQIEAVLLHELHHIKHKDYLANILTMTFEVVFFYHPVMWWLAKNIRQERENRCDDQVTKIMDKKVYAHALLSMEGYRQSLNYAIPFANKSSNLKIRIMRIFEQKPARNLGLKPFVSLLIMVVFLMGFTFSKLEEPAPLVKVLDTEQLEEQKRASDNTSLKEEKVFFRSENSRLGISLVMTGNTLIAKSEKGLGKLFVDDQEYPLNKKLSIGKDQIATMYMNDIEDSFHFFSRKYFEKENRQAWEQVNKTFDRYTFDKDKGFFIMTPAEHPSTEMEDLSEIESDGTAGKDFSNSKPLKKLSSKPATVISHEIYGPLVVTSADKLKSMDSTNLELLKRLVQKYGANDNSDVLIKIDGKELAEGDNIKKSLGSREIMKIKIVSPSKAAEVGVIEIYTDAVMDAEDFERSEKKGIESTAVAEEQNTDSIQVSFETEDMDYAGEVRFDAEKASVLEALGYFDDDPLFVIDGSVVGSKLNISHIQPNEIERINVIKDKKAIKKYGEKGKNGVVEIYLKKE